MAVAAVKRATAQSIAGMKLHLCYELKLNICNTFDVLNIVQHP